MAHVNKHTGLRINVEKVAELARQGARHKTVQDWVRRLGTSDPSAIAHTIAECFSGRPHPAREHGLPPHRAIDYLDELDRDERAALTAAAILVLAQDKEVAILAHAYEEKTLLRHVLDAVREGGRWVAVDDTCQKVEPTTEVCVPLKDEKKEDAT